MAKLDARGHEVLDDTPLTVPVGWVRPPSLEEQIRRMVRTVLSERAAGAGFETFEEADDFDVGDDFEPSSPWELNFDQEMAPRPEKGPSRASLEPEVKAEGKPDAQKAEAGGARPEAAGGEAP